MSKEMWEAVKAKAGEVRLAEAKRERRKRGKGIEKGEGEKKKT